MTQPSRSHLCRDAVKFLSAFLLFTLSTTAISEIIVVTPLRLSDKDETALLAAAAQSNPLGLANPEARAFKGKPPFAEVEWGPHSVTDSQFRIWTVRCERTARHKWTCDQGTDTLYVHDGELARSMRLLGTEDIDAAKSVFVVANESCQIRYWDGYRSKPDLAYDEGEDEFHLFDTNCGYAFKVEDGEATKGREIHWLE